MAYQKTDWQNLPNTTTPVIAEKLNNMENELEKLDNTVGTDEFDNTKNYTTGQYCIKENVLYKATEDILAGEWNDTQWTATTISKELESRLEFEVVEEIEEE